MPGACECTLFKQLIFFLILGCIKTLQSRKFSWTLRSQLLLLQHYVQASSSSQLNLYLAQLYKRNDHKLKAKQCAASINANKTCSQTLKKFK